MTTSIIPPYEIGPIRPPSEAASLYIRATRNCHWNRCKFCPVYKGTEPSSRPLDDVLKDVDSAADFHGDSYKSAFIQDADAIKEPTENLLAILGRVRDKFPSISRITVYGRASSINKKSLDELRELQEAGLSRIHRGLETGYDPLQKYMKKGSIARIQIESGHKVKQAGIILSDYVLAGLAGNLKFDDQPAWMGHARETARVCNEVNPNYIRIRTLAISPRSPLFEEAAAGEFKRLSDPAIVREIRLFVDSLDGVTSRIESDHMLNTLMELKGTLPQDKQKMLDITDRYLQMDYEDQLGFRVGVLLGFAGYAINGVGKFHTLDQFERTNAQEKTREMIEIIGVEGAEQLLTKLHQMTI
ncbi:MAG: radical SAM protein [Nanoarchaeota archaeon]|nr:radical SAM protein [Nanoarchaeota archaeon]